MKRDKTFATSFLYTINVRFQEFLQLSKLAKNRDNVNGRILNVSDLIQGVRFGIFSLDLPMKVKSVDEKNLKKR